MKHIFVLIPAPAQWRVQAEVLMPEAVFHYLEDGDALSDDQIRQAAVLIGHPPAERMHQAGLLEWVHLGSAGIGAFSRPDVLRPEVLLTNSSGAYGLAIAEHLLAMLLAIQKRLHQYRDNQHQAIWRSEGQVTGIRGSRTLIVGLGDIGSALGRRMRALGGYVTGIRRNPIGAGKMAPMAWKASEPDLDRLEPADRVCGLEQLDQLLPEADIVCLSLPSTAQTRGLFTRERIERMAPGAILLNVGRGDVLDQDALCDAIESGHLRGAGLDVTDPEPLPVENRLWRTPNVLITPHVSGGYHLPETLCRIQQIALENLARYAKGEPLWNQVDRKEGYRAFRP